MKTYIFTVQKFSSKRNYNRTVTVHRIKNNQPIYVGSDDEINTASYKGDRAIASKIISDNEGYKMDFGGYNLISKEVNLIELYSYS